MMYLIVLWYILTTRLLIIYGIDNNNVMPLVKKYNVKITHRKVDLKLCSISDAIDVLVDSI